MIIDSGENKQRILAEFLQICKFDGWNEKSLQKAIKNCAISENFLPLIFENNCLSLAEFYIESYNQKAAEKILNVENFSSKKIRDKIRLSLYERFEVEINNKIQLQRLINFYLNPKNFLSINFGPRPMIAALKASYLVADSIWKNINDQSTDFNFYTKRLTLAKIILRSLDVFVKDESPFFQKTKDFIDLEIDSVMRFEKHKSKIKNFSVAAKATICDFFVEKNSSSKSPKEIIKNLPFFRLIKF